MIQLFCREHTTSVATRPRLDLADFDLYLFSHHMAQYPCPHAHARAHSIMRYTVLPSHDVTCKCNASVLRAESMASLMHNPVT